MLLFTLMWFDDDDDNNKQIQSWDESMGAPHAFAADSVGDEPRSYIACVSEVWCPTFFLLLFGVCVWVCKCVCMGVYVYVCLCVSVSASVSVCFIYITSRQTKENNLRSWTWATRAINNCDTKLLQQYYYCTTVQVWHIISAIIVLCWSKLKNIEYFCILYDYIIDV